MTTTNYLFIFLLSAFFVGSDAAECEPGWAKYKDGYCIQLFSNLVSYDEAKYFCSTQGDALSTGSLVMVKEADMQEFLSNYTHDVYDNLWLGARYDNDTSEFLWDDGEPLQYTNWQEGYPRNMTDSQDSCIELRPTNAKDSISSDGNWANVVCQKRNLVICQRTLTWTLVDAVTQILRIQKQLEDVNSRVVPVGSTYVEYSNQASPSALWPEFTWEDVTESYAGLFFRASGGGAGDWGATQAACTPVILQCDNAVRSENGWSSNDRIVSAGGNNHEEGIRIQIQECEVRPKNQAVRIWRRNA